MSSLSAALACAAVAVALFTAHPASQGSATAYTLYTPEGRRQIPFRTADGSDRIRLDQLASAFNLNLTEDTLVGGLIIRSTGQTILLIPGQSFASIGPGRVVSLPGPIERDRNNAWEVPVEFIRQALGPALGLPVDLRRDSHVILVGDVHLPRVTGRSEANGRDWRVTLDIQPPAPFTIVRTGNRLAVRFDAVALDFTPIANLRPEFVGVVRTEGTSVVLTLGPSANGYRVDDSVPSRLVIDLLAPPPPPSPVAPPAGPAPAPSPGAPPIPAPGVPAPLELPTPGTIRTVVIDPGHGGDDAGAHAADGTAEKDVVLRIARRLKSAIESRIGVRVLLTRQNDENVPLDRRAALANNNKADLYISLHANASVQSSVGGAQVLTLRLDDYRAQAEAVEGTPQLIPVLGGGMRSLDVVPWDIAQVPFVERSAVVGAILATHLRERNVPLFAGVMPRLPLRTVVGANMPAIMVEVGFLTNPTDANALASDAYAERLVDAIVTTIGDVRGGIPAPATAPAAAPTARNGTEP